MLSLGNNNVQKHWLIHWFFPEILMIQESCNLNGSAKDAVSFPRWQSIRQKSNTLTDSKVTDHHRILHSNSASEFWSVPWIFVVWIRKRTSLLLHRLVFYFELDWMWLCPSDDPKTPLVGFGKFKLSWACLSTPS